MDLLTIATVVGAAAGVAGVVVAIWARLRRQSPPSTSVATQQGLPQGMVSDKRRKETSVESLRRLRDLLLVSVLDPLWNWLKKRSWSFRVLVLMALLFMAWGVQSPEELKEMLDD